MIYIDFRTKYRLLAQCDTHFEKCLITNVSSWPLCTLVSIARLENRN